MQRILRDHITLGNSMVKAAIRSEEMHNFLIKGVIINRSNSYGGFNHAVIGLMDWKSQGHGLPRLSVSLQMKTNVIDVFGQAPVNSCGVWLMGQQQFVCVCVCVVVRSQTVLNNLLSGQI